MSQDVTSKTKEKKAARDAERRQKTKKPKQRADNEATDHAGQDDLQKDFVPLEGSPQPKTAASKKRKRTEEADSIDKPVASVVAAQGKQPATKKQKKSKPKTKDGEDETPETTSTPANSRFIVFIGNLPYSATDDTIREHFKSLAPFTLRHRTDPKTKKSKGFAFLEFENYDRMKTCLKLFHHSVFEEPEGTQRRKKADQGGRRINVELTAGGGGKNEGRKEKIRVKNERLEEQRKRRMDLEKKEKAKKERKEAQSAGGAKKERGEGPPIDAAEGTTGIHPSRLGRIQA